MLAGWASECVERVLPVFEERHPQDDRPRKALEVTRAFARGEISVGAARQASLRVSSRRSRLTGTNRFSTSAAITPRRRGTQAE